MPNTPITRDPREDGIWFQRLPAGHHERFRQDWQTEREDWERAVHRERRAFRRCLLEGAGLFAAAQLVAGVIGLAPLLIAIVAGGLVALAWWQLQADALLAPILAMPVFFGLNVLVVYSRMGAQLASGFGFARFALVAFGLGSVASYLARERQAA